MYICVCVYTHIYIYTLYIYIYIYTYVSAISYDNVSLRAAEREGDDCGVPLEALEHHLAKGGRADSYEDCIRLAETRLAQSTLIKRCKVI